MGERMQPGPGVVVAVRVALLALGATVVSVAFLDFCDLVYDCGCRASWAGAADACNVHDPDPPHCPWCATGWVGAWVPYGTIVLVQGVAALWPGRLGLAYRALLVLLAFPLVGGLNGLVFGWVMGYWSA